MNYNDTYYFFQEALNPNSRIHGAFAVASSIGTIWALILTIKAVNDSRNQTKLEGKKRSMDVIFKTLEDVLNRIIYYRYTAADAETHFGRLALYRAKFASPAHLGQNPDNFDHVEEYLATLSSYGGAVALILSSIDDDRVKNEYFKRLKFETEFVSNYIAPIMKTLSEQALRDGKTDIAEKIKGIQDQTKDLLEFDFEGLIYKSSKRI